MRILFLGEATSPYTRVWTEHSAAAFGHEVHLASLQRPSSAPTGVTFHALGRRLGRLGTLAAIPPRRGRRTGGSRAGGRRCGRTWR